MEVLEDGERPGGSLRSYWITKTLRDPAKSHILEDYEDFGGSLISRGNTRSWRISKIPLDPPDPRVSLRSRGIPQILQNRPDLEDHQERGDCVEAESAPLVCSDQTRSAVSGLCCQPRRIRCGTRGKLAVLE